MNNRNMYEINSELEELVHSLVKRIRKISNKHPERLDNIMRGVKLVMREDVQYITGFFDACMKLDEDVQRQREYVNPSPSKVEMNMRYGMAHEEEAIKRAANFITDVVSHLGPGKIPQERQQHLLGDVKEAIDIGQYGIARHLIEGAWIPDKIPQQEPEFIIGNKVASRYGNMSVTAVIPDEESVNPETTVEETVDEPIKIEPTRPVKRKEKAPKARKRLTEDEVEKIAYEIANNPDEKPSVIMNILKEKYNIDLPSTSFLNVKNKVVHNKITDKFFTLSTDEDGKMKVIPTKAFSSPSEPISNERSLPYEITPTPVVLRGDNRFFEMKKKIAIKRAGHEMLLPDELEFLIKEATHTIRSNNVTDIVSHCNRMMLNVSVTMINDVLNGARNNIEYLGVWNGDESPKEEEVNNDDPS